MTDDERWSEQLAGRDRNPDRTTEALRQVLREYAEEVSPQTEDQKNKRWTALQQRLAREGLLDDEPRPGLVQTLGRWLSGSGGYRPYPALAGGVALALVAVLSIPLWLHDPVPPGFDLPDRSEDFLDYPLLRDPTRPPQLLETTDPDTTLGAVKQFLVEHGIPYQVSTEDEDRVVETYVGIDPAPAVSAWLAEQGLSANEYGWLEVRISGVE